MTSIPLSTICSRTDVWLLPLRGKHRGKVTEDVTNEEGGNRRQESNWTKKVWSLGKRPHGHCLLSTDQRRSTIRSFFIMSALFHQRRKNMADIFNEQLIKVTISFRVEVFATLSRKNPLKDILFCVCAELLNCRTLTSSGPRLNPLNSAFIKIKQLPSFHSLFSTLYLL